MLNGGQVTGSIIRWSGYVSKQKIVKTYCMTLEHGLNILRGKVDDPLMRRRKLNVRWRMSGWESGGMSVRSPPMMAGSVGKPRGRVSSNISTSPIQCQPRRAIWWAGPSSGFRWMPCGELDGWRLARCWWIECGWGTWRLNGRRERVTWWIPLRPLNVFECVQLTSWMQSWVRDPPLFLMPTKPGLCGLPKPTGEKNWKSIAFPKSFRSQGLGPTLWFFCLNLHFKSFIYDFSFRNIQKYKQNTKWGNGRF